MRADEQKLIDIASDIERMMKTKGWKYFQKVWFEMAKQVFGGIEDGRMVTGQIHEEKNEAKFHYLKGYSDALVNLQRLGLDQPINQKNRILEAYTKDEQQKVNRYEQRRK